MATGAPAVGASAVGEAAEEREDDVLRATARRAEDALLVARARVAAHGRLATARARDGAERAASRARARATRDAVAVEQALIDVVAAASGVAPAAPEPGTVGPAAVAIGTVRVRRHTDVTADVAVPLLVPAAAGGVRIVAGEDRMEAVLALAARMVSRTDPGGRSPVLVVNPRRRPLPRALGDLSGLRQVRDGQGLLRALAAPDAASPRLVVLDHPHDLGLAGQRAVQAATAGGPIRALVVHVAADGPDVDLEHRRLRIARSGVPHPAAACELWPARCGWRWTAHPALRVTLPGEAAHTGVGEGAADGRAGCGETAGADTLAAYEALLERLAEVARDLDLALAAARAEERRLLDEAAAVRRQGLEAIAVEERAIELLLRRAGRGRAPPERPLVDERLMRTAAPRGLSSDPRDLAPLRAARAALARAVETANRARDG